MDKIAENTANISHWGDWLKEIATLYEKYAGNNGLIGETMTNGAIRDLKRLSKLLSQMAKNIETDQGGK